MSNPQKVYLSEGQTLVLKVGAHEYEREFKDVAFLVLNEIIDAGRPKKGKNSPRVKKPRNFDVT